jgi:lipopolysaccharide transport system ATP-binding protein
MGKVSVQGLGKSYKRYPNPWGRMAEWGTFGKVSRHTTLRVLEGISFEIAPGESVGIIGQNGAGKSTLLKILTGTTRPTEGRMSIDGRVAALLELGMGFHPDFTGSQNVYLLGLLMGMTSNQISEVMPNIINFSELPDFMDQPLRVYSSGMVVRLAFSTATAIRPDILIVDEALSVGDAYFQYKCIKRIREFRAKGTTLLFVSHDPGAIKTLCDRAILLDKGLKIMEGSPDKVLDYYNALIAKKKGNEEILQVERKKGSNSTRSGSFLAHMEQVDMLDSKGRPARAFQVGESVSIKCRIYFHEAVDSPTIGILIRDRLGNDVFGTNSFNLAPLNFKIEQGEQIEVTFQLSLNIGMGNYSLTMAVHTFDSHLSQNFDWWDQALVFQIVPGKHPPFIGLAYLPTTLSAVKI